jgi:3-methylfumaryl-CoA hydratase
MKQKIRYTDWVGRTETTEDVADESKVARMYATLNAESPENLSHQELPNLWHWMYFSPIVPFSDLGSDGHPKRGNFLPPVDLPRRMWAGGRLEFFRPLQVGQEIARTSTIKSVQNKNGRTGEMVFVTVSHEVSDKSGMILIEEQDIVYRDYVPKDRPTPRYKEAVELSDFSKKLVPDPVTLFRYSALTFNGHRIHYDRKYCLEEEGYPGLVFHGPLTATLLICLLTSNRKKIVLKNFEFRALKPLFDTHTFVLHGKELRSGMYDLWAVDHEGHIAMEARATGTS